MNDAQHALYRYLTLWCDFRPDEARQYCFRPKTIPTIHKSGACSTDSVESIYCPMEQSKNRRAA